MGFWLVRPSPIVRLAASSISTPTGGRGASAPYVGDFRVENDGFVADPDGRTLTAFLNKVLANGAINGTWKLETIDSNTSAPSRRRVVDFWTLELEHRHEAGSRRAGAGHSWAYRWWFSHRHRSRRHRLLRRSASAQAWSWPPIIRSGRSARSRGGSTPRSSGTST